MELIQQEVIMMRFKARLLALSLLLAVATISASAATVDPALGKLLSKAAPADRLEVVITYHSMPTTADIAALRLLGITTGIRYRALPMVAVLATPAQIRAITGRSNVRSVWSNTEFRYYTNHTRPLIGLTRLQTNAAITKRNGGVPISGRGVGIAIIDSGVDGAHADLRFDLLSPATSKMKQNVKVLGRLLSDGIGAGIVPSVFIENVINTDNTSGHGTFVAGCAAGSGAASGGIYGGVAPGAKIIGIGTGETLVVTVALAAFDYVLTHQFEHNIRIVNNSWGGNVEFDPDSPVSVAIRQMHDSFIAVVFAAGNDGPGPETLSIWARSPFAIGVGAGTKDGRLANFSSRGFASGPRGSGVPAGEEPVPQNFGPSIVAPGAAMVNARMAVGVNVIGALGIAGNSDDGTGTFPTDLDLIPPAFLPAYTTSSGTSFAAPSYCGAAALVLEADPTLLPDELKKILEQTATPMPGYAPWEVGAGYLNVAAAVDLALNRNKPYGSFNNNNLVFYAAFTTEADVTPYHFDFTPAAPPGAFTHSFNVREGASSVLAVMNYLGDPVTANNTLILNLFDPTGERFFTTILPLLTPNRVTLEVKDPRPGNWILEVSGFTPLGIDNNLGALPDTIDGEVNVFFAVGNNVTDIAGHAKEQEIERALMRRLMDSFADSAFRPDQTVTREDLARTLALSGAVRQNLLDSTQFTDVSASFSPIASAVTARGAALKDTFQRFPGAMSRGTSGASFFPAAAVNRLDLAVALVRALGLEQQAQARMSEDLGSRMIDQAAVPADVRGFVAVALDLGLLETFPAELRQIGPGQFEAIPGPRFEPNTQVTRADLAAALNRFADQFFGGPATVR
jgi:serine protease AprX